MKMRLRENVDNHDMKNQVDKIEDQLGKEAEINLKEVKDMCKNFSDSMGSMNMLGVWKHFKKLNPKIPPYLPVAKVDLSGNLVTNDSEVKELLLNTFMFRMRHRPIRPDLVNLQQLRERIFSHSIEHM